MPSLTLSLPSLGMEYLSIFHGASSSEPVDTPTPHPSPPLIGMSKTLPAQHPKWTKGDFELVSNDGVAFRTYTYHLQSAS